MTSKDDGQQEMLQNSSSPSCCASGAELWGLHHRFCPQPSSALCWGSLPSPGAPGLIQAVSPFFMAARIFAWLYQLQPLLQ